jgi:hypothetical protein
LFRPNKIRHEGTSALPHLARGRSRQTERKVS